MSQLKLNSSAMDVFALQIVYLMEQCKIVQELVIG